jgi:aminoacrylate hydrolase
LNVRFDEIYRKVPIEQKEELQHFRSTHPFKRITIDGHNWDYLCSPARKETILFLVGGLRYAEFAFRHIMALEEDYRVIVPSYGSVPTIEATIDAIKAMLNQERIGKAHVVGQSLGGLIAQCIVRKYPEQFQTMILSNTTAPVNDIASEVRRRWMKTIKKRVRIMRWFPYWLTRRVVGRKFAKMFSIFKERTEFWKAFVAETFRYHTTKQELINTSLLMLDLAENYTFSQDDLRNWSGRILLIGSDYDPSFDTSEWEAIRRLYPQAEEYTFHGTGHLAIIIKSEEYLQVISDFIS